MNYIASNRIEAVLDDYIMLSEEAAGSRPAKTFHASATSVCWRQQVYDILGYPKHETASRAKWIRSRDVGNLIHTHYSELFRGAQILVANEQSVAENEYEIGGRLDDLLWLENQHIIVDIKTVSHAKWVKVPRGDNFQDNYEQLQLYLYFLGLPEGILLYVNRSDNEIKEFSVFRDEETLTRLLKRYGFMKYCKDNRIIPCEQRSFKCMFCPFQQVCKEDGPEEFRLDERAR